MADNYQPVYKSVTLEPARIDDLRVPLENTKADGSKQPTFTRLRRDVGGTSQGVFAWSFSDASEEELYFSCQIPHTWKLESTVYPHIHWCPSDNGSGNVKWGLEYSLCRIGDVFPVTNTIEVEVAVGPNEQYTHILTNFPTIDMTGIDTDSSTFVCRLYRTPPSGGEYAQPVFGIEFDFHIQNDDVGGSAPPP